MGGYRQMSPGAVKWLIYAEFGLSCAESCTAHYRLVSCLLLPYCCHYCCHALAWLERVRVSMMPRPA
jgi:hypothetical protein